MAGPIRVMCVDDHPVVREGITRKIELQPDMQIVASVSTGEEGLASFLQLRPDITLMDLRLPGMTGLATIKAIRAQDAAARIIVLTMYEGDDDIHKSLQAGASAYLLKHMLLDDLVRVVRDVHAGGHPMGGDVAMKLAQRRVSSSLTRRETAVVELIAAGKRNKEIAADLEIAEDTVEVHIRNIFAKLSVSDRTAAVTVALRRGIIHLTDS